MSSVFQYFVWFSLTFPWLFQSVQNSLTFPWLENAFPFFQVFQFFQSECEPWFTAEISLQEEKSHSEIWHNETELTSHVSNIGAISV